MMTVLKKLRCFDVPTIRDEYKYVSCNNIYILRQEKCMEASLNDDCK